jgi:hypothetical protein
MLLTESKIREIVRETIQNILKESQDYCVFYDYLDEYSPGYIFQMYDDKERLFNLINPSMYKQALSEFMKYGKFVKFPTKYIYQWMGIIMANTAKIHSITAISGHDRWFPIDDFVDYYFMGDYDLWDEYKHEHYNDDYDDICEYLDNNGFYDWTKLPDGSDAWSDYGLQPLIEICTEYNENMSPEEVIVLINRALDVTHQRGDLASAFIVGGSKTLSEISN